MYYEWKLVIIFIPLSISYDITNFYRKQYKKSK